jgi:hypothetical protein
LRNVCRLAYEAPLLGLLLLLLPLIMLALVLLVLHGVVVILAIQKVCEVNITPRLLRPNTIH